MNIALTDATTPLGGCLADLLRPTHTVVAVTDLSGSALAAAFSGVEVLCHVPELLGAGAAQEVAGERRQLDDARQFYLLLQAAVAARVRRVVHVSSLAVMSGYEGQGYLLSARWCPRPRARARDLALYSEELILREFVYRNHFVGMCLRVDERWLTGAPSAVDAVARGCLRGLAEDPPAGQLFDSPVRRLFGIVHVEIDGAGHGAPVHPDTLAAGRRPGAGNT